MSRTKKIILASLLMVAGLIVVAVTLFAIKFDFSKMSNVKYEENIYEITEDFISISVDTETADVIFLSSENGECKVICNEAENMKHSVSVKDGALLIEVVNEKEWHEYISIFDFGKEKITVYLPGSEYKALTVEASTSDVTVSDGFKFESVDINVSTGDVKNYASATGSVKIKASTGDICVENISAGSLELDVSTGDIRLKNVKCEDDINATVSTGDMEFINVKSKSLTTSGSTGDVLLEGFIATDKLHIERSTGEIELDGCDASEIYIETSTGDVRGSVLSDKTFIADSSSGDIDVPKETVGGRCYVKTSSGDIVLLVER